MCPASVLTADKFEYGFESENIMEKETLVTNTICEACSDGEHGECFYGFRWSEQQCLCGCEYEKLFDKPKLESEFIRPDKPIETRQTF
jgi:hypothetical protein